MNHLIANKKIVKARLYFDDGSTYEYRDEAALASMTPKVPKYTLSKYTHVYGADQKPEECTCAKCGVAKRAKPEPRKFQYGDKVQTRWYLTGLKGTVVENDLPNKMVSVLFDYGDTVFYHEDNLELQPPEPKPWFATVVYPESAKLTGSYSYGHYPSPVVK